MTLSPRQVQLIADACGVSVGFVNDVAVRGMLQEWVLAKRVRACLELMEMPVDNRASVDTVGTGRPIPSIPPVAMPVSVRCARRCAINGAWAALCLRDAGHVGFCVSEFGWIRQ